MILMVMIGSWEGWNDFHLLHMSPQSMNRCKRDSSPAPGLELSQHRKPLGHQIHLPLEQAPGCRTVILTSCCGTFWVSCVEIDRRHCQTIWPWVILTLCGCCLWTAREMRSRFGQVRIGRRLAMSRVVVHLVQPIDYCSFVAHQLPTVELQHLTWPPQTRLQS